MEPFKVFPLYDVNIVRGNATRIYDDQGKEYLDLYGGHAVLSVGHTHPYFVQKVTEQLNKMGFYSNSVINKLQLELADTAQILTDTEDFDALVYDCDCGIPKPAELSTRQHMLYPSSEIASRIAWKHFPCDMPSRLGTFSAIKVRINSITIIFTLSIP